MSADIAVIIPHYNDHHRLARCLEALGASPLSGADVVVVDNGSDPPVDDIVARHPGMRLVSEPRKGAAAARNRGVAETTAPRLAFLDADCVPGANWLAVARAQAEAGTVTGGFVGVFDETDPPRSGAEAFETVFAFRQERYIEEKGFSVTANLVTTRAVFDATGPFIVGLSEDADWCRRAVAGGARLRYCPELQVDHPTRSDWSALRRKWQRLTRESFALHRQGGGGRGRWAVLALAMPFSALAHLPRVLTHSGLDGSGERLAAVGTLLRLRLLRGRWMLGQCFGRTPS